MSLNSLAKCELASEVCRQWRLIQFDTCFALGWVILVENRDEPLVVRWFEQVDHFLNDDVLQQILGLLNQFDEISDEPWCQLKHGEVPTQGPKTAMAVRRCIVAANPWPQTLPA